jgi:hypothetical protein
MKRRDRNDERCDTTGIRLMHRLARARAEDQGGRQAGYLQFHYISGHLFGTRMPDSRPNAGALRSADGHDHTTTVVKWPIRCTNPRPRRDRSRCAHLVRTASADPARPPTKLATWRISQRTEPTHRLRVQTHHGTCPRHAARPRPTTSAQTTRRRSPMLTVAVIGHLAKFAGVPAHRGPIAPHGDDTACPCHPDQRKSRQNHLFRASPNWPLGEFSRLTTRAGCDRRQTHFCPFPPDRTPNAT